MRFSSNGQRFTKATGIGELMADLDLALNQGGRLLLLGGGNPGRVKEIEDFGREALAALAGDAQLCARTLGVYDHPQGSLEFREQLADYLTPLTGQRLSEENIAICNGSQNAFAALFALFGGQRSDGVPAPMILPALPEYVGYADVPAQPDYFCGLPGLRQDTAPRRFRYSVDFESLEKIDNPGGLLLSRPTNPTGNVLADEQVQRLSAYARRYSVPLILDAAYGLPFPGLIYDDSSLQLPDGAVLVLSLSKVGLPGVRTGIVVGPPEVAAAVGRWNAVMNLSGGSIGPALGLMLLRGGKLTQVAEILRPHYQSARDQAIAVMEHCFGRRFDWRLHEPLGAFFLWVEFPGLPVDDGQLYTLLKQAGVITVPGSYFFPGSQGEIARAPALRISYARPFAEIELGLSRIGDVVAGLS